MEVERSGGWLAAALVAAAVDWLRRGGSWHACAVWRASRAPWHPAQPTSRGGEAPSARHWPLTLANARALVLRVGLLLLAAAALQAQHLGLVQRVQVVVRALAGAAQRRFPAAVPLVYFILRREVVRHISGRWGAPSAAPSAPPLGCTAPHL